MEYREMGKTGLTTSLLGYGCMRFPTLENGKIDREEATKLLLKAYDNGVNYFDTAYPYHNGESERFVGDFFETTGLRDKVYLATKLPLWKVNTLEDAKNIFEEQLAHLKTDYIDFFLLHACNRERFDKMVELGVPELLEQYKAEGKIRNLGFSFHDNFDAFKHIIEYRDWDFCQIQLNYMDTDTQAGLKGYELAKEMGVPMVIMEPAKGGSLTTFAPDICKIFSDADASKSVASWAFRWVGSLDNVKVVLSGMTAMDQLDDNLKTFGNFEPLSEAEKAVVAQVVETVRSRVNVGCTGCAYCQPCPAGVAIPRIFRVWNEYAMYNNAGHIKWAYTKEIPDDAKVSNCIECGACESQCPQNLPIRDKLKEAEACFLSL